ncbi:OmpH family outer membrane protein [Salicola sp. Rm-C-2C1-2]|uniref:OmpH family outer membrane protein n=1 Tax=Salicola sp. Rm-C-2C1-2 TaxID=3141321 RepID=UPI0032E36996
MRRTLTIAAALLIFAVSVPTVAQERIGVVNLREAVFSSDAGAEFGDVIQGQLKQEQQAISKLESEAQDMQKRLESDSAMMNESEREDLQSRFEKKVQEYQQRRARFQKAVNQRQQQFLQQSRPAVDAAMETLLDKHDLDIVIPAEAVIYAKPDMDLTDQMIELLNQQNSGSTTNSNNN